MVIPPTSYLPHRKKLHRPLSKEEQDRIREYDNASMFANYCTVLVIGVPLAAFAIYRVVSNPENIRPLTSQLEKLAAVLAY